MKMKMKRTLNFTLDTAKERKRIRKCFRGEELKRLNQFMDAFESWDMKKACELLHDKWWQGYSDKAGCPRMEFIGLVHHEHFANFMSYGDLACMIANSAKEVWEIKP